MEVEVIKAKEELAHVKGDCKEKYSKLEGAIDQELELSPSSSPKGMLIQKRTRRLLKNRELGKDVETIDKGFYSGI